MFGSRSLPQVMAAQRLLAMMQAQSPQGQMPTGQSLPGATPMGANPGGAPSAPQPFANAKLPQTPGAVTAPKPAAAPMAPGPATPMGPLPGQAPLFGRRPLSKQGAPAATPAAPTPAALGAPAADGGAPITWTPPPALVAGLPGGRSAPSPAAADDQPITVSTRFQPYDGPLAMEEGRGTYQRPPMTWAERLQIIGATMQQMGAPDGQIAATTGAMDTRHRQRFQEERDNRMFETRIAGLRNLAAHVERENPEHPWLRVLGQFESPQQAVDAYFAYEDRLRDQGNVERDFGLREELGRGELALGRDRLGEDRRQFDQGYILDEQRVAADIEAMEAGVAQGWAAQNTRDRELEYTMNIGGRNPYAQAMGRAGAATVQGYIEDANAALGRSTMLDEFAQLNNRQDTGPVSQLQFWDNEISRLGQLNQELADMRGASMTGVMTDEDRAVYQRMQAGPGRTRDQNATTINAQRAVDNRIVQRAQAAQEFVGQDGRQLPIFQGLWTQFTVDTPLFEGAGLARTADVTFDMWLSSPAGQAAYRDAQQRAARARSPSGG